MLATTIAETSLTIEGIRVVVDSGLRRYAEFDPATGMSRLVTGKGIASGGRPAPRPRGPLSAGDCYRLWSEGTHASLNRKRRRKFCMPISPRWRWNLLAGVRGRGELALAGPAARGTAGAGARSAAATRCHRRGCPSHASWPRAREPSARIRAWRTCWSKLAVWARRGWRAIWRRS